ncbi:hypothetical protein Goklo_004242 [Gossypium klotzschianum]|uniref:Uncharacterized protein n=1 Tax=Gossypium klotzschianum TaxID=34286 RepID=A0A7J8VN06_9ROSI|nr:hypothetical protein [Gossypium klotzschianum]
MGQLLRGQQSFPTKRTFARHFWGRWNYGPSYVRLPK